MEAQSSRDALVEMSGVLRGLALALVKICNDLRWMGSGPHAGLAEITLPAVQPGSSIMPGKVNPVVPEAVIQACFQVVGLDAAIAMGATASTFQLNTAMPLIGCNLVDAVQLLSRSAEALLHLVPGITRRRRPAPSLGGVVAGHCHLAQPARRLRRRRPPSSRTLRLVASRSGRLRSGWSTTGWPPPSSSTRHSMSTASPAAAVDASGLEGDPLTRAGDQHLGVEPELGDCVGELVRRVLHPLELQAGATRPPRASPSGSARRTSAAAARRRPRPTVG